MSVSRIDRPLFEFPPFRLDARAGQLFRGAEAIPLRPKTMGVLLQLLQRPGELVTKSELLAAVWPRVVVHEAALKNCVRELREQLGDDPQTPRFIQTVHARGYRFVGALRTTTRPTAAEPTSTPDDSVGSLVGRSGPLQRMRELWRAMATGQRQMLFIAGESGIGKSALVDAFIANTARAPNSVVGRGQCIEQYGAGEPFLPVVEALSELCRSPGGPAILAALNRLAPDWVDRIPGRRPEGGRSPSRMPVERAMLGLAEALEDIAADQALLLSIEDLQWSDTSTLELLALLARRKPPARLLILLTYRMDALSGSANPVAILKQELLLQHRATEMAVGPLSSQDIYQYLRSRYTPSAWSEGDLGRLAACVYRRTEGHPLFMIEVLRHLNVRGVIFWSNDQWQVAPAYDEALNEVPSELQVFIDQQVDRLDPEQRQLLEMASLVGPEFSARVIPQSAGLDERRIDDLCTTLVRRGQMIRFTGEKTLADGRVIQRYGFVHALHQETISQRLPPARRTSLYREIAYRGESIHQQELDTVSRELSRLFRKGREFSKAADYYRRCARRSLQSGDHDDARSEIVTGLELLSFVPDSMARSELEMSLRSTLAQVLIATRGWAAPETGDTLTRLQELCVALNRPTPTSDVIYGLMGHLVMRGRLEDARQLGTYLLAAANDSSVRIECHAGLADSKLWSGDFRGAVWECDQVLALTADQSANDLASFGRDPRRTASIVRALALLLDNRPIEGRFALEAALATLDSQESSFTTAASFSLAAMFYQVSGDAREARRHAERSLQISARYRFTVWEAFALTLQGWAISQLEDADEGIRLLQQGMSKWTSTYARWGHSYFPVLLADAHSRAGRTKDAMALRMSARTAGRESEETFFGGRALPNVQVS